MYTTNVFLSFDAHNHVDDYSGTLGGVRKVHISALVTSLETHCGNFCALASYTMNTSVPLRSQSRLAFLVCWAVPLTCIPPRFRQQWHGSGHTVQLDETGYNKSITCNTCFPQHATKCVRRFCTRCVRETPSGMLCWRP